MPDPVAAIPLEGIVPHAEKGVNDLSRQVHILVVLYKESFKVIHLFVCK